MVNAVALFGLWRQRRGLRQLLGLDLTAQDGLYLQAAAACVLLFFGVAETFSAALLSWSFRRISRALRPFTGLQMFSQLAEATAVQALGLALSWVSPLPVVVLQQFFVLRLMLGGGLGKQGDWHTGKAMSFHYWSQPLPNPLSRFFHSLSASVHKLECRVTLMIEGWPTAIVSLMPGWVGVYGRTLAALAYAGLMLMINASGNYGHLGLLSVVQGWSLVDDMMWLWVMPWLGRGEGCDIVGVLLARAGTRALVGRVDCGRDCALFGGVGRFRSTIAVRSPSHGSAAIDVARRVRPVCSCGALFDP